MYLYGQLCGPKYILKATLLHLDATVWNLPSNSIQICQLCDMFVILMIKNACTKSWVKKKLHLIIDNEWMDDGLWGSSGALRNPRKPYFLQLAANAIKDVTIQRDKNGISYIRKAMIWCGILLNLDGAWTIQQFFREL